MIDIYMDNQSFQAALGKNASGRWVGSYKYIYNGYGRVFLLFESRKIAVVLFAVLLDSAPKPDKRLAHLHLADYWPVGGILSIRASAFHSYVSKHCEQCFLNRYL